MSNPNNGIDCIKLEVRGSEIEIEKNLLKTDKSLEDVCKVNLKTY
jgi:hypothetical protein